MSTQVDIRKLSSHGTLRCLIFVASFVNGSQKKKKGYLESYRQSSLHWFSSRAVVQVLLVDE